MLSFWDWNKYVSLTYTTTKYKKIEDQWEKACFKTSTSSRRLEKCTFPADVLRCCVGNNAVIQ